MRTVPIDAIKIGARFRKDYGDLDQLARSIADLGLLQPVGVTPDGQLVFGHRRLLAAEKLGKDDPIEAEIYFPSGLKKKYWRRHITKERLAEICERWARWADSKPCPFQYVDRLAGGSRP
jgi:hypothetical protein